MSSHSALPEKSRRPRGASASPSAARQANRGGSASAIGGQSATGASISGSHASENSGAAGKGKYDRILQAAVEVFAANGYFNSRISDIARNAGVADGTVYLYFKNKEQILMAAIDHAFHIFMAAAEKELATIEDPRERLHRLAYLHLHSLGSNRGLAMVFQTELRQSANFLGEFSHRHLVTYFDLVRSIVQQGQKQGTFKQEASDKIVANAFFGALDAMVTSWLLSERDYDLGGAAKPLVDLILGGLEAKR